MIPAAIALGTIVLVGGVVLLDLLGIKQLPKPPKPPTDCTCPRCDAGGSCGGAR